MKIGITKLLFYSVISLLLITDIVYCLGGVWIWDLGYKMTFPHETDANIFLWIASVIIIFWVFYWLKRFRHFSSGVRLLLLVTVSLSVIWMVISILDRATIFTVIIRQYSPFMLVFVVTIVLGTDDWVYHKSVQVAKVVMLIAFILTIYAELNFMLTYGFTMRSQSSSIHVYYWEGILSWLFYIFNTNSKEDKLIAKTSTILFLIAAFLTSSRSNIMIAFLSLFLYYRRAYDMRKIKIGAYIQIIVTVGIGIWMYAQLFPDAYNSMMERLFSDSRSGQYEQFFEQVSLWQLFIGQGMWATYSFSRFENFAYVDNANLVMAFRYGLIPTVGMLLLLVNSLWTSFKKKSNQSWQIILIWLLVTNGFSVYLNYRITWGYFLVWLSVGHILLKKTQKVTVAERV